MKVLITGASGRLGPYVIQELEGRHELVLMSRTRPAHAGDHDFIQGDLRDFEACRRAVAGVDCIQHLGAQSWPSDHPEYADGKTPFDATMSTNIMGTYYLMRAATEAKVKSIVMAGSNCALGHGFRISGTELGIQWLPIDETHPCEPEDSYSWSKLAGESLLASLTQARGIRTYVTRISGISPLERRRGYAAAARPATGWDPWLVSWVGSEDVARAHRMLMEAASELPPHDVYYLNADDTTALEPSAELVERFRPDLAPKVRKLEGHASFIDNSKLKRAVGWRHETSWRALLVNEPPRSPAQE